LVRPCNPICPLCKASPEQGFFYRPLGFYRRVAVTGYTAVYR
jgi:hypothetical protein